MKIKTDTYRDGGTVSITDGETTFYIDGRLGTKTRYSVYDDYPTRGNILYSGDEKLKKFFDMVQSPDIEYRWDLEKTAIRVAVTLLMDSGV